MGIRILGYQNMVSKYDDVRILEYQTIGLQSVGVSEYWGNRLSGSQNIGVSAYWLTQYWAINVLEYQSVGLR